MCAKSKMQCPNKNNFCFVCGQFTPASHMHNITRRIVEGYFHHFGLRYLPYLWYQPEKLCAYCYRHLYGYTENTRKIRYVEPIIWLPRDDHDSTDDCFFCVNIENTIGFRYQIREKIKYKYVESIIPAKTRLNENVPVELQDDSVPEHNEMHNEDEPSTSRGHVETTRNVCNVLDETEDDNIPKQNEMHNEDEASTSRGHVEAIRNLLYQADEPKEGSSSMEISEVTSGDVVSEYIPSDLEGTTQHRITQEDFNDIIRDGKLSYRTAELIGSRLKQWNLVADNFKVTSTRKRQHAKNFDELFILDQNSGISYCMDVNQLFQHIGRNHVADEWRLFIDSSINSLVVVLLHIGNDFPSVPIAYSTITSETYEVMQLVLELINYEEHKWLICCDLKVVGILTGVKKGFAKHQCFLCTWEGRRKDLHYTSYEWADRAAFQIGVDSIDHLPLVPSSKIILPPLHIKLGMISNFIKALDKNGFPFKELEKIFPKLSAAKISAGI